MIWSLNFTWSHFHCTTLFFIILPRKVHYLFSYFEKSGKKIGHPQKSCLTPPLRGGGAAWIFCEFCFRDSSWPKNKDLQKIFWGVPRPQPPTGAHGAATPIFGQFLAQLFQITSTCPKPKFWVASGLLNSYMKFHQDWTKWLSYKPKTICPFLSIRTKFDKFRPINWLNVNIFE